MINSGKLAGKTIFITGATRGIGKAIALKVAKDGANVVIAAKTIKPHPKLPGTIYTAAEEVEKAGGKAFPCPLDIRDESAVKNSIKETVDKFGGIDILVNNASAISLTKTLETEMKRYDLMHNVNTRGTFLVSKECLPHLMKSSHAHILNLSPPINLSPHWFSDHCAYTIAKYGMSMCVLGMSEEFKSYKIGVNALWPKTSIHTAAAEMLLSTDVSKKYSRTSDIVADAAYAIFCRSPATCTGNFFIDEDILRTEGITDFKQYACIPENADKLILDAFLDDVDPNKTIARTSKQQQKNQEQPQEQEQPKEDGKIPKLFEKIENVLNEELVNKTKSIYQFNVLGNEKGTWYLDLKNGSGCCGQGEPPQSKADAILTMDSENFFKMFTGKLKPASAFMTGKLKISGDLQKAMKLEKLMRGLKSRL